MAAPHAQWCRGARVERGWGCRRAGPGPGSSRTVTVEKMRARERTPTELKRRVIQRPNRKQSPQPQSKTMQPVVAPPGPPAPLALEPEDENDIPLHAAILPVLGSLLLTVCWGYELYLSTPSLQKFVHSLDIFR